MSTTEEIRPTAKAAFVYTPKWELWYNGIIWQAVFNVVNSYNLLEMVNLRLEGQGIAITKVPDDMFVRRVQILYSLILPGWPDNEFKPFKDKMDDFLNPDFEVGPMEPVEALRLFQAILGLLHRRGNIRFKPPRDPAD